MATDFKTTDKYSDLFDTLFAHFGKTINMARIKFLSKMLKAFWASLDLKVGQSRRLYGIYLVNGQYCYLSAARMKNRAR